MKFHKYDENLPFKINLECYACLNSHEKTKEDPISSLITNYSEITSIVKVNFFTKVLDYNKKKVHTILYDNDKIIRIDDSVRNDLATNFYLSLLISDDEVVINYEFSLNYIKNFNNMIKNKDKIYNNIINSKIIIQLINNYNNCDLVNGNVEGAFLSELENEKRSYIKNHLNVFKEICQDLKEEEIYSMNISELYNKIIISLIKNKKLSDYDYSIIILEQMDLENIDIPFESENLFEQIQEALDIKNDYIKDYIIRNSNDFNNEKIIIFYYLLLKYIIKNKIYIYHIPLLFNANQKIIEFIKAKEFTSMNFMNCTMKERFDFVIKQLCNLDYYYSKYIYDINNSTNKTNNFDESTKNSEGENKDNNLWFERDSKINKQKFEPKDNIKFELLEKSMFTFDISTNSDNKKLINNINIIYGKNKKISYNQFLELNINKNKYDSQTNSELNKKFNLFSNFLSEFLDKIETILNEYNKNFDFELQIQLEIKKTENNNLYITYCIPKQSREESQLNYEDEDILGIELDKLNGFNNFVKEIIAKIDSIRKIRENNSNLQESKVTLAASNIISYIDEPTLLNNKSGDKNNKNISGDNKVDKEQNDYMDKDEINYQLIKYEKMIYKHLQSCKFFLHFKNGFSLSIGDDQYIKIYKPDFEIHKTIKNIDDTLYHVSEIYHDNENYVELIACYSANIYLIKIDFRKEFNFDFKKYEIPGAKILFCNKISNNYVLVGINTVMNVEELFNDLIEQKKMSKLSNYSFISGCSIDNYFATVSNRLIPGGNDELSIFNLSTNRLEFQISDYTPTISENPLYILKLKGKNKLLLCACKKYNSNSDYERNGILYLDASSIQKEEFGEPNYSFYDTNNFEPYCFCQIWFENKIFFFAGGYGKDIRLGSVKLFTVENNELKYLQDIEDLDKLEMPVNSITQCKDSGKIVITTTDGAIHLFSEPNIKLYLNI